MTKGDARRRHATTYNMATSRKKIGKWEERCQRTRGNGALIGQGCALRGRGRVERMSGRGIDTTASWQTRDDRGGGESNGDGNGNGKCRAPPSRDLATTALVLAAEAAAALISDNADGGTGGVAIIGRASLGNKLTQSFICY